MTCAIVEETCTHISRRAEGAQHCMLGVRRFVDWEEIAATARMK